MPLRDRSTISEPLNDHSGIVNRRQSRFEMSALAFRQMLDVLQWTAEFRFLGDDQILLVRAFVTRVVLEILYLLQGTFVLSFANNRRASCNVAFVPLFYFFSPSVLRLQDRRVQDNPFARIILSFIPSFRNEQVIYKQVACERVENNIKQ